MSRFNLYLLGRPRRWTDALKDRVRASASPATRGLVEAFVEGAAEGPVLLVADDDPAWVKALWEQCHAEGLAVCIFDHSTLWDRLRDRLRALRTLPAPSVLSSPTPAAASSRPATDGPTLRDPGALALGPRARAALMAAGAFIVLVAVGASMVPEALRADAPSPASEPPSLPSGAGGAPRAIVAGGGSSGDAQRGQGDLRGASRAEARPSGDVPPQAERRDVAAGSADAQRHRPGGGSRVAALLGAFALGFAVAWGVGLLLPKKSHPSGLQGLRRVILAFFALVALVGALSRLAARSAVSEPPPPPPPAAPAAASEHAAASDDESRGPFARFLRRRRGAAGGESGGFRAMLSRWRQRRVDAGVTLAAAPVRGEAPSAPSAVTEPREPSRRASDGRPTRHRRAHRSHRHARDAAVMAARTDAAVMAAPSEHVANAPAAPTQDTTPPAAPTQDTTPPAAPAQDTTPPAAPAQDVASVRSANTAPPRRAPPLRQPSTWSAIALGALLGVLSSPRWRAIARGSA